MTAPQEPSPQPSPGVPGEGVGFVSSPHFVQHDTGPHHPERPDRIRAIYRALIDAQLIDGPDPFPDFRLDTSLKPLGLPKLKQFDPISADEKWITLCHTLEHVERIKH